MIISTAYSYKHREIVDLQTLVNAIRFLIANAILTLIFFFLTFEEIDWAIFSFRHRPEETVIDNSPWNLKNLFLSRVRI